MIYLRKINNDTKGHRMYLPPELIRQLGWFKGDQIAVTVDSQRRMVLDKITPERHPDFFKVDPVEIINDTKKHGSNKIIDWFNR